MPLNIHNQPKCQKPPSGNLVNTCFAPWSLNPTTFQCELPPIPNCSEESEDHMSCEECEDGFFFQETIRSCVQCDLPMCDMCEKRQSPTGEYTSCLKCDSNYALTKEFVSTPKFPRGDRSMPRYVCEDLIGTIHPPVTATTR